MLRIKPIGFSILVQPDDVEDTVKLADGVDFLLSPDDREKTVITEGTILAIADGAWSDKPEGSYPKVGDRVIFAKYAGSEVTINKEAGLKARLMIDEDIKAVILEENEDE